MTRLEPAALLAIDGVDVARTTTAGVPDQLLAMDGLSIDWGREEVLDQAEPATGSVSLFDPSRRWHRSRNWVGARVTLRWEVTVAGVTTSRTFFRGRIGRVNPVLTTLAGVRGTLVTLDLTSVVADLGNIVPTIKWESEAWNTIWTGMPAGGPRQTRIINHLSAAGFTGGLTIWEPSVGWWNAVSNNEYLVDDQQSILDHVVTIYDSFVQRMNYSPQSNGFSAVPFRDYASRVTLGRLVSDPAGTATDRAGQGVYATARAIAGQAGLCLPAGEVEYPDDAGITRDQTTAITRIRLATTDFISSEWVPTVTERLVAGSSEALTGIRTLNVDSGFSSTSEVRQLNDWETLVRQDAAVWQLEPVTVRTAATGGFEDLPQLLALLSGEESAALVFLQGSELPLYGMCPVVGIMGGTIAHRDGHWEVVANLAAAPLVARQHPLSFEELDTATARIQVWDSPHPQGFHPSLTFEDLAWVGLGHGVPDNGTATLTNQGWDYLA